ncbi:MAG: hypothetical protein GF416_08160 [Candidatus Altiarchaeales archaeon]|nr:hypothetical protein [Candidatus Altiarchaeales archaeon]MBD3417088.1 hypothetical protein [Candidatus Altiarchaeales archaeon]
MTDPKRVLDVSGVLRSSLDFTGGGYLIPDSVLSELRDETARTAVEEGIRNGSIKIAKPAFEAVNAVTKAASETGDDHSLSVADVDVLAVAYERSAVVISDDYAIQNTASRMGLEYETTSADGIGREITWRWICAGCKREMSGPGGCEVCGHQARRRPEGKS